MKMGYYRTGIILFAILQLIAGLGCLIYFKRLAKLFTARHVSDASSASNALYRRIQWDSPFQITIARVGFIFWGMLLVASAYVTAFGPVDLTLAS